MADFTKTVDLIFGGKDQVSPVVRDITRSLDQFETGITKISGPLATATDTILKVDAAIVALGAAVVGFAINDAVKLQSAQIDLQKVLGESEGSVDQYAGKIKELSLFYGVLQTDTTAALSELKQAGYSIADSFLILENSLIATKVSELDAVEASTLLKATLKGFSLEAAASTEILDTWNETSNNFGTNTHEIAIGLAQVSGVAKQAGLSIDETTALLVPMIEVFGSGSEAATALRTGLLKVGDTSSPVQAALKELEVSQTDFNGKLRASGDIFFDVIAALQRYDDAEKQRLISQLVGINQTDKLTQTFSKQGEILQILETLTNKQGSAQKELEQRMKATEEALKRLNTAFVSLRESIGNQFLDSTSAIADGLKNIFVAASNIIDSGGLGALFGPANDFASRFAETLNIVAKNLPAAVNSQQVQDALKSLAASFESLGLAISDLFGGVDLRTQQGLEDALTRLIKIFESLVNVTSGITDKYLKPLFASLEAGITTFSDLDDDTQKLIGSFLGVGKSIDVIVPLVGGLLTALGGLFQIFGGIKQLKFETSLLQMAGASEKFNIAMKGLFLLSWGEFIYNLSRWADLNDKLAPDWLLGKDATWSGFIGDAVDAFKDLFGVQDKSIEFNQKLADSLFNVRARFDEALLPTNNLIQAWKDQKIVVGDVASEFNTALVPFGKLVEAFNNAGDSGEKMVKTIEDGVPTFSDGMTAISQKFKTVSDSAEDTAVKTDEAKVKLEELASNERIKSIEAVVDLNVAQLESQTKIATTLLEGLANTITSTGDVLNTIFGLFTDSDLSNSSIQRLLDREYKIREDAAKIQNEYTEAQIAFLKAQTDALSNGDGIITINGDGLAPELEAFMMKVLERIQVRVSQDRSLYLLGLPA